MSWSNKTTSWIINIQFKHARRNEKISGEEGGAGLYKNFFNKPGHNFDDVSKTGYPRSS